MNPLSRNNYEQVNIPYESIYGPNQHGNAKQLQDYSSIQSMSQEMNEFDTSNGLTQILHGFEEEGCDAEDKETTSNKKIVFPTPVKSNNSIPVGLNITLSHPSMMATEKVDYNELNEHLSFHTKIEKCNSSKE